MLAILNELQDSVAVAVVDAVAGAVPNETED